MKARSTFLALIFPIVASLFTLAGEAQPAPDLEALIRKLADTTEMGYGYSASFSGSQFLPYNDADEMHTLILGRQAPERSEELEGLVRAGMRAVPALLKHLSDERATKIPSVKGMMFTEFSDEYDYNRRTRKDRPEGVNHKNFFDDGQGHPDGHTLTVGDLCFVALGQIVNRNFQASRYQPSGGMVISSPTYSKTLREQILKDYDGFTAEKHKRQLIEDFTEADSEYRRIGAYRRLAYYYPDEVEALVLKQLATPDFDAFAVEKFARESLYKEKSESKRKELFDAFLKEHGAASKDGLLLQLFEDMDMQDASDAGRLHPKLTEHYDARALLVLLYGYKDTVKADDKPMIDRWEVAAKARFIKALVHDTSKKIDDAVHAIFSRITDDDYLALACMARLEGRVSDEELINYCRQRIGKSKYNQRDLKAMLEKLLAKPKHG
ncbi:MAG TPA: hypothetical protein VKX17_03240 [Planctomycetota bacterium]|nr:hypothetical protein [Planctomycetota bacterium]